ncbi:MAG TPA: hypothetical protein VG866_02490 [Candidatus Paceibacterota bacterium]|nr:hypothetical protein [Candidatus Paceibacterota bacterium]
MSRSNRAKAKSIRPDIQELIKIARHVRENPDCTCRYCTQFKESETGWREQLKSHYDKPETAG